MTLSRKSTWSNSDGLDVGFGSRFSEREATAVKDADGSRLELSYDFTFESTTLALSVPAGFLMEGAYLVVGTAWVSSGTCTITVGDGGDADGWFTTTALTEANLTAGAMIQADGAYIQGDDGGAEPLNRAQPKLYSSADTLDIVLSTAGNAASQGSARLVAYGRKEAVAAV